MLSPHAQAGLRYELAVCPSGPLIVSRAVEAGFEFQKGLFLAIHNHTSDLENARFTPRSATGPEDRQADEKPEAARVGPGPFGRGASISPIDNSLL